MQITIPQRENTPATRLYGEVVIKNEQNLQDREVILFLPGGPGGNHTLYEAVQEPFFKMANLIFFDPRGCGNSDPSDAQYCTIDHYIDDIESVRQFFAVEKITLVGGSYGAMAALGYAIKYPQALTKLILIAGAPSYRFIETAKNNLAQRGTVEQKQIAEKLWTGNFRSPEEFAKFYKIMAPLYVYHYNSGDKPPTTKPNIPYNIAAANLGFSDFLRKFDFESDLEKIKCPTLILSGQQDWVNDPCHARLMAEKIPQNTLHIFDECGHFIWQDQPEKFWAAVREFLLSDQKRLNALDELSKQAQKLNMGY